jgi:hypothetical protein
MVGGVIGIARVMVILRERPRLLALRKHVRPGGGVRAIAAHQWDHATDLRDDI